MAYLEHPSPWLAVGGFAVLLGAVKLSGLPRFIQPASGRLAAIDGLRGVLAMSVFFHHFFISYQWKHTGRWSAPPTHLYDLFGTCGVALFFMITGFLFFGRLRATRGTLNLNNFCAGRVIRLMPVYLASVALIYLCALIHTGTGWSTALRPGLDEWLFLQPAPIGGDPASVLINAGVQWTLPYEWIFYFALPLLAATWARLRCESWALLLLSIGCLWLGRQSYEIATLQIRTIFFAPFALGGLVGELGRAPSLRQHARTMAGTATCALSAAALFFTCDTAYSLTGYFLLCGVFAPIALGNTLFGVLRSRTVLMLGEISYDLYLLHGIVLYGLYTLALPQALPHAGTPGRLLSLLVVAALGSVALATLVHLVVERPALRLGRRLVMIDRTQELAAP
jgi:peptidoglycan/LPS O-acetylase OafA/YrhL